MVRFPKGCQIFCENQNQCHLFPHCQYPERCMVIGAGGLNASLSLQGDARRWTWRVTSLSKAQLVRHFTLQTRKPSPERDYVRGVSAAEWDHGPSFPGAWALGGVIHTHPGCCLRWCRGSRPCSIATVRWLPSVLLQMLPCGSCEIISFCSIIYGWKFSRIHTVQNMIFTDSSSRTSWGEKALSIKGAPLSVWNRSSFCFF